MEKVKFPGQVSLGVCYYPEHWPETLWEDDLTRMREYNLKAIRIAEFAWSKFEPDEGVFDFGFFDRFMEVVLRSNLQVIFGTPTATPPAWLTHKYPETLNARPDGVLYRHGMRRHYNYNSSAYREFSARIVEKIAEHYCPHPSVIGWQIDNELNCETDVFYSDSDHAAFRAYLRDKFKTLDSLNEALGTVFWNQTYGSWEEIHLPRPTVHRAPNPHLALEEKRFISQSTISFCKMQADIIRKYLRAGQFITTNGLFGHLDSHEMADRELDFISYDSYPNFAFDLDSAPQEPNGLKDRQWAMNLAKARSISSNFAVMEQQSGPGGWDARIRQPAPKPGQMRLWTFQSIAHGADYISYFRWRTSRIGTEIYWHGINDYSNEPNRRLDELKRISSEIGCIAAVTGTKYRAGVALMKDYDNEWDGEQDQWHGPLERFSENGWLAAAQRTHTPMDLLYLRRSGPSKTRADDLFRYGLVVYPHATILTEETAKILEEYVERGGTLIMGARTGYKDEYGRCPMRPMPGYAAKLCGTKVTDYTFLVPEDEPVSALWDGEEMDAPVFNDVLEPGEGGSTLAVYKGNYYDGAPALVTKKTGKGTAYYYGAGFSASTAERFLRNLNFASQYGRRVELPAEVELAVRTDGIRDYLFLLNYAPKTVVLNIREGMRDMFSGEIRSGKVELERYGVMVLDTSV